MIVGGTEVEALMTAVEALALSAEQLNWELQMSTFGSTLFYIVGRSKGCFWAMQLWALSQAWIWH
jgi:hypothetical protein